MWVWEMCVGVWGGGGGGIIAIYRSCIDQFYFCTTIATIVNIFANFLSNKIIHYIYINK